jgi:hypothetical protein
MSGQEVESVDFSPSLFLSLPSGEDFSDPGSAERSYDAMKSALHQHVVDCGGNAVVVVDEAQKALPRALDGRSWRLAHGTRVCGARHVWSMLCSRVGW